MGIRELIDREKEIKSRIVRLRVERLLASRARIVIIEEELKVEERELSVVRAKIQRCEEAGE